MLACPKEILGLVLDRLSDSDRFNGFGRSCRKLHDLALALPYRRLVITHTDLTKLYKESGRITGNEPLVRVPRGPDATDEPKFIEIHGHGSYLGQLPSGAIARLKGGLLNNIDPVFIEEIRIATAADAALLDLLASKCKKVRAMEIVGLRRLKAYDFGKFPTLKSLYLTQMDYADELKFPALVSLTIKSKQDIFDGMRRIRMRLTPENDHTGKRIEEIKTLESLELGPGFFVKSTAFPKMKNYKVAANHPEPHDPPMYNGPIFVGRQASDILPPPNFASYSPPPQPEPQSTHKESHHKPKSPASWF